MNIIIAINNGLFRFKQRIVHSFVKTKLIGPTAQDLGLDSSKPIVYALQYQSHAQELVILPIKEQAHPFVSVVRL